MSETLKPPPWRTTSQTDRMRQGRALAELISAVPARRRAPRMAFAVGTVSVVVATMGARAAYVALAPATDHTVVHCYTSAGTADRDLGTDTNYRPGVSGDAAAVCAALWRAGVLQLGKAEAQPAQGPGPLPQDRPVPALAACTRHGQAAVFPGDPTTCKRLGLPVLKR